MREAFRLAISTTLLVLLSTAALAQQKGGASDTGVCTEDNALARDELAEVLSAPALADFRKRTNLTGAEVDDAEILKDPEETSICARLQRRIPRAYKIHGPDSDWVATYFLLRDRYVVTVLPRIDPGEPPAVITWGQTIILDRDFNVLATTNS